MTKTKSAIFDRSFTDYQQMPNDQYPEFAFVGRSNVGKSSLINMLTAKKGLAKTSGQPGKTRLINRFVIDNSWGLVDLPGYGFAKTSHSKRREMEDMVENYICKREQLNSVFQLIDSRLKPQKSDIGFSLFLGQSGIPFSFVFTKCDKLSGAKISKNISLFKTALSEFWEEIPPVFMTSVKTGKGRQEILGYIRAIRSQNCEKKVSSQ